MKIEGAVLDVTGAQRPYADSAPITVSELELDEPRANEILIRMEAAGLCHSDLSVVDGSRRRRLPMLLGHEGAGRIEQVGKGVSDLRPGQRVITTFLPRCGQCEGCASRGRTPCVPGSAANAAGTMFDGGLRLHRDGQDVLHHLGVSAFATHAVVDQRSVVAIDDGVPAPVAALLGCAALTGGGAVMNAAVVEPGETVIVVGLGGVGLAALLVALAHDDVNVIGVDTLEAKRQTALEFGASMAAAPDEALQRGLRAPVVIEAAGNARAFETAVALTGAGGRTVSVGLPDPEARSTISPLSLVAEGRSIIGSYLGSALPERDIPKLAEMWRGGRLPLEKLISSTITLEEVNAGMDELAEGRSIRQIIRFDS